MFAKLAILLHGKLLALAVAGIVVVGGGTAVTVAATTGALPILHGAAISTSSPHENANDDHGGANATKTPTNSQQNDDQHERNGVVSKIGAESFELTLTTGSPLIVTISTQTQFHDGLKSLADLKDGDKVEVKGSLQSDGSFAASDVQAFNSGDDNGVDNDNNQGAQDLHGTVVSVASASFVITVSSSEDGVNAGATITVIVSTTTTFKDVSGIGALKAGDNVEVKGALQANGALDATSVERSADGDSNGDNNGGGNSGSNGSGGGDN